MKPFENPSRSSKKKILLISYHFPPSAEVGGLRISHFVKNLPHYGWVPFVLTIKDRYLKSLDRERLKEMTAVNIFRTCKFPTIIGSYIKIKRLLFDFTKNNQSRRKKGISPELNRNMTHSGNESLFSKLKRYIDSFLTLPDKERNWIIPASFRAIREIRKNRIDCILTSSPPYSAHLIGLIVKRLTKAKWVADFRDPWMTGGSKALFSTCDLSIKIERYLEKIVINNADLIVSNTGTLCDLFKKSYPKEPLEKFRYISNGIDWNYYLNLKFKNLKKYEKFTITHAGTIYFGRSPEPVFEAIHSLFEKGIIPSNAIRVKLIGDCQFVEGIPIERIVKKYELEDVVEVIKPVPYSEALEMIKRSHIALLLAPNQPYQIPAKVYDYLGLEINILALTEKGATADLISSTGAGKAVSPKNIGEIEEFIRNSFEDQKSQNFQKMPKLLAELDSRHISESLAESLDRICTGMDFDESVPKVQYEKERKLRLCASQVTGPDWPLWVREFQGNIYNSLEWAESQSSRYCRPLFFHWLNHENRCAGIAVAIESRSPVRFVGRFSKQLTFESYPAVLNNDANLGRLMINDLLDYSKKKGYQRLTIQSYCAKYSLPPPDMNQLGFNITPRFEFITDLTLPEDELWNTISSHHRRQIRKAQKADLQFEEICTMDAMRKLRKLLRHSRDRRVHRGEEIGLLEDSYYYQLAESHFERGLGRIFLMTYEGEAVSGAFVTIYNGKALYLLGGSSSKGFEWSAPPLLFWKIFGRCREAGCTEFNMGGVPASSVNSDSMSHGLFRFKAGFGGYQRLCVSGSVDHVGTGLAFLVRIAKKALRSGKSLNE